MDGNKVTVKKVTEIKSHEKRSWK